jgi:hypothetical protein
MMGCNIMNSFWRRAFSTFAFSRLISEGIGMELRWANILERR